MRTQDYKGIVYALILVAMLMGAMELVNWYRGSELPSWNYEYNSATQKITRVYRIMYFAYDERSRDRSVGFRRIRRDGVRILEISIAKRKGVKLRDKILRTVIFEMKKGRLYR